MLRVWKRSPLLRLLLPLVAGILLQIHLGVHQLTVIIIAILSFIALVYLHFWYRSHYLNRHLVGFSVSLLMASLGVILSQSQNPLLDSRHISNLNPQHYNGIMLRLTDAPVAKEKSLKTIAEVIATYDGEDWYETHGELLVYLQKDSSSLTLAVDDTIVVNSKLNDLQVIQNPFEFNYKKYLQSHFIYSQLYASADNWKLKAKAVKHSFFGYFVKWRESLLSVMRSYGVTGQEYAVLSALVLGKTSEIDYHLMLSYASAGAIHILAVSGLHVALIYIILSPLIKKPFPKNKYRYIKSIIPIVLLWLYAGITGFSPSVLRAACMFSCFIIADNFAKSSNIFNTMSASALILLWWNPFIIMEVGFQLSYLAVLGIVILQRKIDVLIYSKNKIIRWAWGLTSVSIAAQLATFSLGLLYFHQFPNWFLVSNLFVIPLSTIILYVSLAFFGFVWCTPVAKLLIIISDKLTWLMNESMLLVDSIPYSITKGISITILESYIIAAITCLLSYWLLWKKPKALLPALVCIACLCLTQITEKTSIVKHSEICLHNIPKHTCITYTHGEKGIVLYNNALMEKESLVRFHLKNYWDHLGIKNVDYIALDKTPQFEGKGVYWNQPILQIDDRRFVFVDSTSQKAIGELPTDFYIFNGSAQSVFLNDENISALHQSQVILADGLSKKKKKLMIEKLDQSRTHDLTKGALIIHNKSAFHFAAYY